VEIEPLHGAIDLTERECHMSVRRGYIISPIRGIRVIRGPSSAWIRLVQIEAIEVHDLRVAKIPVSTRPAAISIPNFSALLCISG
jgi:hypothetical protein